MSYHKDSHNKLNLQGGDIMEALTDSQISLVINSLEDRIAKIDEQKQELEKEKIELLSAIKNLKLVDSISSSDGRKRQSLLKGEIFTWKTIAIEILKDRRRLFTTDEIYNVFIELKPKYKSESKRNIQASFSSALSQLAEKRQVVRIERKFTKGNLWALPEWFSEDGKILPEFQEQLERHHIGDFTLDLK